MKLDRFLARCRVWQSDIQLHLDFGRSHGLARARHQLAKLRNLDADEILPYLRPISRAFLREIVLAAYEENEDCIVDRYHGRAHFRQYGWVAFEADPLYGSDFYDFRELSAFAARSAAAGMHTAVFLYTGDDRGPVFAHLNECDVRIVGGNELVKLLKEGAFPALPSLPNNVPRILKLHRSWSEVFRAAWLGS